MGNANKTMQVKAKCQ